MACSSTTPQQSQLVIHRWNSKVLPRNNQMLFSNWLCSSENKRVLLVAKGRRSSVVAGASKKKKKNKFDSHSFLPQPDETTGPFPEAVLLKEKQERGDGRVLPEFVDAEEEMMYEFLSLQMESDLNVERMRHYEVVYLIHEDSVDEVESVNTKVQDFIREKKGKIWRLNDWGLRRLAYKIRKASNANYILMNFEIEAKYINDFKTILDKDERIIRHLVMKRDEAITKDCPPPPEFHTLRGQHIDDEEVKEEEGFDDEEVWDDEDEIEMGDNNVNGKFGIIVVDEDEDGRKRSMTKKPEKILR